MNPMLTVRHLTKRFGCRLVIDNLSFTLHQGNRITLFAPSGAGKTTLINILNGFDPGFEGFYRLTARHPATVFQEPRLFSHLTVHENIFLPFQVRRLPITDAVLARYATWLDLCELTERTGHFPFQLSGGLKQKVALIRCFLTEPDFVMLDEPFKSIDMGSKRRIIEHIIQAYPSVTVLLATHNLDEIPLLTKWLLICKTSALTGSSAVQEISGLTIPDLLTRIMQYPDR
ncbi:MAG: ATP-binding cassette domain-containing protein [bacterium]